jgi:hypothetical protein
VTLLAQRRPDVLALSALAREAASQPLPALDWEGIESRLFDRIAESASLETDAPAARVSRSSRSVLAAALAAAALALLVLRGATPSQSRVGPAASDDWMTAGDAPAELTDDGLVKLRLAPGSALRIVSWRRGESMLVALLRGSIHAEVVPRPGGEAFAVEVARTRVAVHGTSFDVTRSGDEAIVAVGRGSVAVGPAGHPGETEGWLVVAPERAAFSLDGASSARWLAPINVRLPAAPPTAAEPTTAAAAVRPPPPGAARPASARALPLVEPPPIAPEPRPVEAAPAPSEPEPAVLSREVATTTLVLGIRQCYERQLATSNVAFSVHSTLALSIAADGAVQQGVFAPPLSPTLTACAAQALGRMRFERSSSTWERKVSVDLSPPGRAD